MKLYELIEIELNREEFLDGHEAFEKYVPDDPFYFFEKFNVDIKSLQDGWVETFECCVVSSSFDHADGTIIGEAPFFMRPIMIDFYRGDLVEAAIDDKIQNWSLKERPPYASTFPQFWPYFISQFEKGWLR